MCWPDYALHRMSSHNKAFIISSGRVATVWELFSARRLKNAPQLRVPSRARTTSDPVPSLFPPRYKAVSVSEETPALGRFLSTSSSSSRSNVFFYKLSFPAAGHASFPTSLTTLSFFSDFMFEGHTNLPNGLVF